MTGSQTKEKVRQIATIGAIMPHPPALVGTHQKSNAAIPLPWECAVMFHLPFFTRIMLISLSSKIRLRIEARMLDGHHGPTIASHLRSFES